MKVDYNKCSRYIKRELGINLFPYQEVMLKAMCEGQEIRCARGIGRSFVANAFGKYIASTVDRNNYDKTPDVVFPYTCAIKDGVLNEVLVEIFRHEWNKDDFAREMLCLW